MKDQEMDSSRWKQIDELLDAAIDLSPDQRPAFLDRACAGDQELRKELERLLASDERARTFFDSPAFAATEAAPGTSRMLSLLRGEPEREALLRSGHQVAGRYQILSRLGKGGMGEVWHAYDLKLRVHLALKTLRLDVDHGLENRVELLRQEIRSAREVISPNVCRIFDLVTEGDQELISMEYIDGITLMEMLEQKGPLHPREAMDIASQFLAGLEAIHAAGLVHRDLKPENIMITRTGRVIVMDLGIAQSQSSVGGMIAGTHPYMSLEQLAGKELDARSDIFSAGVVLAEMIHTKGSRSKATRENLWKSVRRDPMQIPESPWKRVIARAVAENREERFESASALARALEETILRTETIEDRNPYPGLASFTSENADFFFGRESETEALLQKLQQLHLMALIGSSGAGKTSFLHAGLIPTLPKEWCAVVSHPGDNPLENLAHSIAPLLSNNPDSIAKMLHFEDPDVAVSILSSLRKQHVQFVLIVDRFEELFTQNPPAVQSRLIEILGRAPVEADIRVLLVMRDDFLISCKEHAPLSPIFSELSAMVPMKGASLRRALIQPALKCGYRFEDENLVYEILSEVETEKSSLPLMAFAASLLWERRDHNKGLLTRQAYESIGKVHGALAQHAENVMVTIGSDQETIVHEIFRNLMTAQNTRVARDTEELLSVFPKREPAEAVLRALIDARLLTSFEAKTTGGDSRRRVEISHESLLSNWPRLVRWQTQDADSAQMRDQLRQASQLWDQRGRSADLLWTGATLLEYQAWRQRYSGRLTAAEEAFAQAMAHQAGKKRRQRRVALATIFVVIIGVAAALAVLWRNASVARDTAVAQTQRAEARRVLAVARSLPDLDPSTKLAYALQSLEFADTPEARQFAMQAMAEGPAYRLLRIENISSQMSPDGRWIAVEQPGGSVVLVPQNGSTPIVLNEADTGPHNHIPWYAQFSPDSKLVLWTSRKDLSMIKVWSIPEKKLFREFSFEGVTICFVRGGKAFFISDDGSAQGLGWKDSLIRVWDFSASDPQLLGKVHLDGGNWKTFDIDQSAQSIAYEKADHIFMEELNRPGSPRLVGIDPGRVILQIRFNPNGSQVASGNGKGEIKIWSRESTTPLQPVRILPGNGQKLFNFWFDNEGRTLISSREGQILQWDLAASLDAEPIVWRQSGGGYYGSFDSQQHWQEIAGNGVAVYTYSPPQSYTFRGTVPSQGPANVRFLPDGKSFINGFSEDGISIHTLPGVTPASSGTLWNDGLWSGVSLDIDRSGKLLAAPTDGGGVYIVSIRDGKATQLKGLSQYQNYGSVALSPDGKTLAARDAISGTLEIFDVETGKSRVLPNSQGWLVRYSPDGTLFSADSKGNLCRWSLKNDSFTIVAKDHYRKFTISPDGRMIGGIDWTKDRSDVWLYDLRTGKSSVFESHGHRVQSLAFDHQGTRIITGDADGVIRVGSITGETPTLLLGHQLGVHDIAVSADDQWILSIEDNPHPIVKLWRMPQGHEKPMQSFSASEFKDAIRKMTNVRVEKDDALPVGFRTTLDPFPGWEEGGQK